MKFFILLCGLAAGSGALADDQSAIRLARQDIDHVLSTQRVPGISVAVIRSGRVVWSEGRGYAQLMPRRAATADTVYEIGSLGKQFTAVAMERLIAEQRIDPNVSIDRYLPGIPPEWSGVTVRRLLTHQAGVAQIAPPDRNLLDLTREYTADEYTALATSVPLEFAPGTANSYSDTGYVLLGFLFDRVMGQFYGDWLAANVFQPLQMTATRIIDEEHPPAHLAVGYELTGHRLHRQRPVSRSLNRTADGSLWSSVSDLARWESALESAAVLPPETLESMWSAATLDDGRAPFYHYGEGWERNRLRDQDVIEYDGSWQGFHGAMARYPALQLAVVVLGNRDDWRAQRLLHDIAGRFDPHARPYRVGTARGGCSGRLRAWLEREIGSTSAMGRELAAIGPIHATHTAERVSKTSDAWVIKVEANSMDDWMTVQCEGDQPEVQSVYREY